MINIVINVDLVVTNLAQLEQVNSELKRRRYELNKIFFIKIID